MIVVALRLFSPAFVKSGGSLLAFSYRKISRLSRLSTSSINFPSVILCFPGIPSAKYEFAVGGDWKRLKELLSGRGK